MSESTQTLTPELMSWLADQRRHGCSDTDLVQAMVRSGWSNELAQRAVQSETSPLLPDTSSHLAAQPVPEPQLPPGVSAWTVSGQRVRILASVDHPRVLVFADLLTLQECEALRDAALPRLSRSETVDSRTGGSEVNTARTSQGMFFERGETPLIARIEQRISDLLNWPVDHGEGLQILRYGPGAEYRPHHDFFDPAHPGTARVLARGGQRVATLVMYLNEVEAGGATTFPDAGLSVHPQTGGAVFFSYADPSATSRTLHGGAPVTQGEKWVATKWFRQRRFD